MESCDVVRQAAATADFTERKCYELEASFNWNNFIGEARSLSLFADKSLLELRLGSKKLPDAGRKALHGYLKSPSPEKIILIISDKLDAGTQKTKWFHHIESAGAFIQIWPLNASELPRWISQRLQNAGLHVDQAGIQLLSDRGEGNLLAVVQDIEKLSLLYPNGKLSCDDVASAISDNARFDLFTLVDAAVSGQGDRVIRILFNLKEEGTEAILILWAITRELRMLATVSGAVADGEPLDQALRANGVWSRRIPLVKKALNRSPHLYWRRLLKFAAQIDGVLKGAFPGNRWDGLERLALGLTGVVLFKRRS